MKTNKEKLKEKIKKLHGFGDCVGADKLIKLFETALDEQRKEIIKEIKDWTKGRNVTKDRLREFLNKL